MRYPRVAFAAAAVLAGVWVAGATLAGGCRQFYDSPPDAGATSELVFGADGVARRTIDVDLTFHGSGRTTHYALESTRLLTNAGEPPWTIDAVEFDAGDWPVELDGDAQEKRHLRIRAHADDLTTGSMLGGTLDLVFMGDMGTVETSAYVNETATTEPCAPIGLEAPFAAIGAQLAWQGVAETSLDARPIGIVSDGADRAWVLTPLVSTPVPGVRLLRATPGNVSAAVELAGDASHIAPGSIAAPQGGATAVLAIRGTPPSGAPIETVTRYDDQLTKLWRRVIAATPGDVTVAASGGRVLLGLRGAGPLVIDDVEVAPAGVGENRWVVLDEATGDFVSVLDVGATRFAVGLPGGAFATVEDDAAELILRDADLSIRWAAPLMGAPTSLAGSADGGVWVATLTSARRYDATGALAETLEFPFQGDFAPIGDGSGLVVSKNAIARIQTGAPALLGALPIAPAEWCASEAAWSLAPTATGPGFAVLFNGTAHALTIGKMGF